MSETYLELTVGDVCDEVEAYTGDTTAGAALKIVERAVAMFLRGIHPRTGLAHPWSFLMPASSIILWTTAISTADGAPVKDNGTSTVTVDDAIFQQYSMIGYNVVFTATEKSYPIVSWTSSKVVVVMGDASGEADADTITITPDGYYTLPPTFGGLADRFTNAYSATLEKPRLHEVDPDSIYANWRDSNTQGTPYMWAVTAAATATPQGHRLMVYPVPDADTTWIFRPHLRALDITDGSGYFLGGTDHCFTIQEMALGEAELHDGHATGTHYDRGQALLAGSIEMDMTLIRTEEVESLADNR